ncbi:hypothetical protein [Actinoalloteichus spitiensis]|uniref:hypothetical protein n=1 Tax=Actinoalloteichus spitiensis TaxID=252394 RepID=UPI00037C9E3F|nr:hypothetical protein [Actinoalloteichus spitiensis]
MAEVTQRSLALLATLRGGHPVPGEVLARLLEVDRRTISAVRSKDAVVTATRWTHDTARLAS